MSKPNHGPQEAMTENEEKVFLEMCDAFIEDYGKYLELELQAQGSNIEINNEEEKLMVVDISNRTEKMKISAMNGVDDESPDFFTYISKIHYPYWHRITAPIGCNCTNGCGNSSTCICVMKNGGEIPFNGSGAILKAKSSLVLHECGPLCKCPPSCMNRVTQLGPKYQLEIFKTESRGWGVRSRSTISPGEFICEYIGEVIDGKEADKRVEEDDYLFDISKGFAIDARRFGNIGRFINHSCSPNLIVQEVLYDHDDKRIPHITFFAGETIPPLTEVTCKYEYKIGEVFDKNGVMRRKDCLCGASNCVGRLY